MLSGCADISALTHTRAQGTAYSAWVVAVFAPGTPPPPPPTPPPSRTNRTRRVPHPVLIGHAASLGR